MVYDNAVIRFLHLKMKNRFTFPENAIQEFPSIFVCFVLTKPRYSTYRCTKSASLTAENFYCENNRHNLTCVSSSLFPPNNWLRIRWNDWQSNFYQTCTCTCLSHPIWLLSVIAPVEAITGDSAGFSSSGSSIWRDDPVYSSRKIWRAVFGVRVAFLSDTALHL